MSVAIHLARPISGLALLKHAAVPSGHGTQGPQAAGPRAWGLLRREAPGAVERSSSRAASRLSGGQTAGIKSGEEMVRDSETTRRIPVFHCGACFRSAVWAGGIL